MRIFPIFYDFFNVVELHFNKEAVLKLEAIPIDKFTVKAYDIWHRKWLLLASGNFKEGNYNCMTIGWGSIGTMWNKPFVQVVVRPTRYTYEFMEKYDTFTLTAFPEQYRNAIKLLGRKSGRDTDKIEESGLTAMASETIEAPSFREAELSIECRKIYWQDFDSDNFLDPAIHGSYPKKDYHRVYFGEILEVYGTNDYI